jgi:hypothetical protein
MMFFRAIFCAFYLIASSSLVSAGFEKYRGNTSNESLGDLRDLLSDLGPEGFFKAMDSILERESDQILSQDCQTYDAIIIGQGYTGYSFAAALRRRNPSISILILDQSFTPSCYGQMRDFYLISQPEFENNKLFPFKSFLRQDISSLEYPQKILASQFGDALKLSLFLSPFNLLNGLSAESVSLDTMKNLFAVQLSNGKILKSKTVFLGTGYQAQTKDDIIIPENTEYIEYATHFMAKHGTRLLSQEVKDYSHEPFLVVGGGLSGYGVAKVLSHSSSQYYKKNLVDEGESALYWLAPYFTNEHDIVSTFANSKRKLHCLKGRISGIYEHSPGSFAICYESDGKCKEFAFRGQIILALPLSKKIAIDLIGDKEKSIEGHPGLAGLVKTFFNLQRENDKLDSLAQQFVSYIESIQSLSLAEN